jgi:hypothetical protein
MRIRKLHFVYNVELRPSALVADFIHRLRDPATYPCRLCDLTYGRFLKKPTWMAFTRKLEVDTLFYTKDEFAREYPGLARDFPVVLAERSPDEFEVFLSRDELAAMRTLEALEASIVSRLEAAGEE